MKEEMTMKDYEAELLCCEELKNPRARVSRFSRDYHLDSDDTFYKVWLSSPFDDDAHVNKHIKLFFTEVCKHGGLFVANVRGGNCPAFEKLFWIQGEKEINLLTPNELAYHLPFSARRELSDKNAKIRQWSIENNGYIQITFEIMFASETELYAHCMAYLPSIITREVEIKYRDAKMGMRTVRIENSRVVEEFRKSKPEKLLAFERRFFLV